MEYLKRLKSQLDCISGNWAADEGVEYIDKLLEILEELNIK